MSRYNKMMTEVLDSIFEGYTLDSKSGKLVVTNEAASKKAQESLHSLVLEKARELWDQLEAAEDSLSSVAEEIRFEEMNTDPSSMSGAISQSAAPEDTAAPAAPDAGLGLDAAPALESAGSISELLSTDDLNLDDIFENMDQLDNHQNTSVPRGPDMPFDEMTGGMSAGNIGGGMGMEAEGDIQDGDEDFDTLSMGMGDEGDEMGDPMGGEMGGDIGGDDMMGDPEMGGDMGGDGMDDMGGFDFDLDLDDPEMGGDLAMGDDGMGDEMGMEPEGEMGMGDEMGLGDEEEIEAEGMGRQSMRMEGKGKQPPWLKKGGKKDDDDDDDDKDDDDKDDKDDDDDDDDDKPAFLKKKGDKDDD
jgi:hypothetical protein